MIDFCMLPNTEKRKSHLQMEDGFYILNSKSSRSSSNDDDNNNDYYQECDAKTIHN